MEFRWVLAFIVAIVSDILDYVLYGGGAVLGLASGGAGLAGGAFAELVLDGITLAIGFPLVKQKKFIISAVEVIPGVDLMPTFLIMTIWAYKSAH